MKMLSYVYGLYFMAKKVKNVWKTNFRWMKDLQLLKIHKSMLCTNGKEGKFFS